MSQMSENSKNFKHFKKKLERLAADTDIAAMNVASRMADVGLSITKENTPVGKYSDEVSFTTKTGRKVTFKVESKQGGYLRRGWQKSKTRKVGKVIKSGYFNNVEYGMYVNNGHRVVNKNKETVGYVKGERMLEQGMDEAGRLTKELFNEEIARIKRKGGW